ncbi:hypothetical protein WCE55_05105 [Luteimonas sp. MJ293]|uniref:hypothetical protein n=1 Tax=Luteimonas sp. MJ146 TaxID=3129240 RepID=UPI0031BA04AA
MAVDPTDPIPESEMRFLRPIGHGLLALLVGFNGAYLLIVVLEMVGGPDLMEWAMSLSLSATVLALVWIVRRSRRKRAEASRRAEAGEPRPRTGVLVASVAMTVMALLSGWLALAAQPVNYGLVGWVIAALAISVPAFVSTVKKMRQ